MIKYMLHEKYPWKWKIMNTARELRKNMTPAEKKLWEALRGRRFRNHKFRRQVPINRFIVDFLCLQHMLIIEVDGEVHVEQKEHDEEREQFLRERNFKILRFQNEEIEQNLDAVLDHIEQAIYTSRNT